MAKLDIMKPKPPRELDFKLLPVMDGMDMFIRLGRETETKFTELGYLTETYERVEAALMFFFQTSEQEARWRNDARLRAGLNEFYSLQDAVLRDVRAAKVVGAAPLLSESRNPLVHLMYLLRHVVVHSRPVTTGVAPISVISEFNGNRHEHSYGAVVLDSLVIEDLTRSKEATVHYRTSDLSAMVDWICAAQQVFGVGEIFRRGVDAYCQEALSSLPPP